MSGELFKRGCERGRCAAGLFADAAGESGVRRSDGFAFRMSMVGPREALARVRHRWAVLCNPFGVGVRRSGVVEDGGLWLGGGSVLNRGRETPTPWGWIDREAEGVGGGLRGRETPTPWIWIDREAEGVGGGLRGRETPAPWGWIDREAEGVGGGLRGRETPTPWGWIDREVLQLSGANIATKN